MESADLFNVNSYKYRLERLSMQQQVQLYRQVSATLSQTAPPVWPHMHAATAPFLGSSYFLGGAMMGTPPTQGFGSNDVHPNNTDGTPFPGQPQLQVPMARSGSLQQQLSNDALGNSSCSSVVVVPSCSPAPAGPQADLQGGAGPAAKEEECDDLLRMFDVLQEEDMASSLASGDSITTVTAAMNNSPPAAPLTSNGLPASTPDSQPRSTSSATGSETLPAPALPATPVSASPGANDTNTEHPDAGTPAAAASPTRSLSSSSSQLPSASSQLPPAYSQLPPVAVLPGSVAAAAAGPAQLAPAASMGPLGVCTSPVARSGTPKPQRTASLPLPGTPASNGSSSSKPRHAGGVKKHSSEVRRKQLQAQVAAAAAAAAGAPAMLPGGQASGGSSTPPPPPAVEPVRGVGFRMLPSAFAATCMDPVVTMPMPMHMASPMGMPMHMASSGGVFSAAAVMSAPEEETANDVLMTTNSLCPALSWMEEVTLAGPIATLPQV